MAHEDNTHPSSTPPGLVRLAVVRVLISGWCPAPVAAALHRRIRSDPAWSAAYTACRQIERAASGRALSPGQVDLVEQFILAAVAEANAAAEATTVHAARPGLLEMVRTSLAPLSAACAMVLMFVAIGDGSHTDDASADRWTARGSNAPRVGVRARCIDSDARRIIDQAEAGPARDGDVLTCPRGSLLSFSMTNLDAEAVYVYTVGVADDGHLRFISPFDESSSSLRIAPNSVDSPLDVVADTTALPPDEHIALFTLFSPKALRGADVARTLRDAQQRSVRVQSLDRLPFEAITTRIELRP